MPETSYAKCGDLSLAYQLFGEGPIELVVVGPFVSHIELAWTLPQFKAFVDQLGTFCRVAWFDKAGVGLSDPVPKVRTLEERAPSIATARGPDLPRPNWRRRQRPAPRPRCGARTVPWPRWHDRHRGSFAGRPALL